MPARVRVFAGVPVRRAVTAERDATLWHVRRCTH